MAGKTFTLLQAEQTAADACETVMEAELLAQLQEAVKPLIVHLRCDTSLFTPIAVNTLGLTVKNYIHLMNVFLRMSDPAVLKRIVWDVLQTRIYDSYTHRPCNLALSDVLKISKWMQSPKGVYCTVRIKNKRQKLDNKSSVKDPEGILVQVLPKQFEHYKAKTKETS